LSLEEIVPSSPISPSFLAFRATRQTSRQHSEPFIFRRLKLRGLTNDEIETKIIGRLSDAQDHLVIGVRTLILAPNYEDEVARIARALGEVWGNLEELKTLVYVLRLAQQAAKRWLMM
jgi:hypothetical protein